MNTQSSSDQIELNFPNTKKSLQFCRVEVSNSENIFHDHMHEEEKNAEDVQMADHLRRMEELLQIPIVGIEDAIVVPAVLANEFELKIELLEFISNNPFFGFENDDPHSHIIRFYQITRTLKINQVPHDVENEPPNSITTWDDLVSKFLNRFYPYSKTRQIRNEIMNFQQVFNETFTEAWERFKGLLRKSGGNLMTRNTQEALTTIKNKGKEEEQESETITEVPPIPYPSRLQKVKFQALENPTGRADHFVYRIDIVDSLCDKFPIQNDQSSGSTTSHYDHSLPDYEAFCFDADHQKEKSSGSTTSHFDHYLSDYEAFCFDVNHQKEKSSGSTTSHSDHSLSDYETFCFDHQQESNIGSTTSHSNHSLPDYETFCFDHQKESNSGSTTSHSNLSLLEYESFYFDVDLKGFEDLLYYDPLIDPPPIAERSDSHHEEFADELAHIISPLQYNHFDIEAVPGELTRILRENISSKSEFSEIDPLVSLPFGNKDKFFDPEILIINGVHSKRSPILPLNDFSPTLFVSDLLFLSDPPEIETFLSFPSGNEDKVFDPEILLIDRVLYFTRKSPHLFNDNFKIDKCHILSEISLKTESSVSFHPIDNGIRGESS
ncbi:reverse transcriptase domain-containing protein [Tanacetum coccineum]